MSDTIETVTITVGPPDKRRPEVLAVTIPPDFVMLEELGTHAHRAGTDELELVPVAAAIIALCCPSLTRMLARNGIVYADHDYQVRAYGRAVYRWLHGQGVPKSEILAGFVTILPLVVDKGWPRIAEVDAALGKSPASAAP